MKRLGTIVAIAVVAGVTGCTNMTPQQQGTMSGAAIGAAAGAGIAVADLGEGAHQAVEGFVQAVVGFMAAAQHRFG